MVAKESYCESAPSTIAGMGAIGPELTFYNASKDVGESLALSNKLLHAQLDAFCRLVLKGDTMEMSANALGFMMESNGIRILEPFDTSMNILRLFLAVEEDILAFLRTTSKKMTLIPMVSKYLHFGDLMRHLSSHDSNKPPTKGVLAVNTSLARVKRPVSFKLVWPPTANNDISEFQDVDNHNICSIWFPEAPKGYVALGCVVSTGRTQPPLSSAFCILASLIFFHVLFWVIWLERYSSVYGQSICR
ncbi:hypothetical protein CsSME_00049923 [Camellia sinensis var. sinensis]